MDCQVPLSSKACGYEKWMFFSCLEWELSVREVDLSWVCLPLQLEVFVFQPWEVYNFLINDRNGEKWKQALISGRPGLLQFINCLRKRITETYTPLLGDFPKCLISKRMENVEVFLEITQNYTDRHCFIFRAFSLRLLVWQTDQSRKKNEGKMKKSFAKEISVSAMKSQERVKMN